MVWLEARSLTTVRDCVSTYISVTPLDIFKQTRGLSLAGFVAIKQVF